MTIQTMTAPAFLASYLINNDASGITPEEREACDQWLEAEGVGAPVDCSPESFWPKYGWNDAKRFFPLSSDCLEYTFLID